MEFKQITIMNSNNESSSQKEHKMRIQTHNWKINDYDLSHDNQVTILSYISINLLNDNTNYNKDEQCNPNTEYLNIFINNLKHKISSYKQQDILKNRFNKDNFTNFNDVIDLLNKSSLKCYYCKKDIFILYKQVKEMSQWTLDRIDNNLGHNIGNLVISCLKCNLKRRRINKTSFFLTKNMTIKKNNYDYEKNEFENKFEYDKTQTKIVYIDHFEEIKQI